MLSNADLNARLDLLTRVNLDDLLVSLGWERSTLGRSAASILFRRLARQFARQVIDFDEQVSRHGLQEGSRRTLPAFLKTLHIEGQENIPASGPLLILANHPGMADTLALFAALPRPDLRVIGNDRLFLRALPAVSNHLIFVPEQKQGRMQVLRAMVNQLRCGTAILTFPAGQIEPDPVVIPGAVGSLETWSESLAVPIRLVPELTIVIAVVSSVLAPQATYHPLTYLRHHKKDREHLGAAIQLFTNILVPNIWPVHAGITFAPPLPAAALAYLHDPRAITQAVIEYARPYVSGAAYD